MQEKKNLYSLQYRGKKKEEGYSKFSRNMLTEPRINASTLTGSNKKISNFFDDIFFLKNQYQFFFLFNLEILKYGCQRVVSRSYFEHVLQGS